MYEDEGGGLALEGLDRKKNSVFVSAFFQSEEVLLRPVGAHLFGAVGAVFHDVVMFRKLLTTRLAPWTYTFTGTLASPPSSRLYRPVHHSRPGQS